MDLSFITGPFHTIIFEPLLNLLVIVFNILPGDDLGIAIVAVTLLIRFVLYPLSYKALRSQKKITILQPQLKEIQEKHKKDKQAQSKAVMAFYKEHGVNPFAGCLPFLVQIPILLGLYRVFLMELTPENLSGLYFFVSQPTHINSVFLGIVDLTIPSPALAILAGFAQYLHSRITFSQKKDLGIPAAGKSGAPDFQKVLGKQMMYILPVVTIFIAWRFPAGLALYWLTTTLFSFGQQYVINRKIK